MNELYIYRHILLHQIRMVVKYLIKYGNIGEDIVEVTDVTHLWIIWR